MGVVDQLLSVPFSDFIAFSDSLPFHRCSLAKLVFTNKRNSKILFH